MEAALAGLVLVSAAFLGAGGSTTADVPQDWLGQVQEGIRKSEYEFTKTSDGIWSAPNRAQDLRARIRGGALEVTSRTKGSEAWGLTLRLRGVGRPGAIVSLDPAEPRAEGSRLDIARPGLLETYWNDERGLEQEMVIAERPGGSAGDPLVLDVEWSGTVTAAEEGSRSVIFKDARGAGALRYGDLKVLDAHGRELPSKVEAEACTLKIEIDDSEATYPILVDPLLSSPSWTAEGDQAGGLFGHCVSTAGDVNGDGYCDVIVGARDYDKGEVDEGCTLLFYGSASGLSSTPAWTAEGNQANAQFGDSVSTAGDVNGDGYCDVIVGAHLYDNGEFDEGRAFVYHGSATGLSTVPDWTAEGNQTNGQFGVSVSTAGDVNGDGYVDVIVGAFFYDNGELDEGRAFVYHGSAFGLSGTPSWSAEPNQAYAWFGRSASTAGDVNGDGYGDVVVGAFHYGNGQMDEGGAFVYCGSSSGLSSTASWTAEGNQASAYFGYSVSMAGDVNGDGFSDVIIGANAYDDGETDEGRAFLYQGSASGLLSAASWTAESNQPGAYFGHSVSMAGDVNGDGYSDVIVGAIYYDNGEADEGRAFLYQGSPSGLSATPAWAAEVNQAGADLGISVSTAGDVNGDGYSDVIAGSYYYDNGETDEGRAFVYYGAPSGLSASSSWAAEGNQAEAKWGYSVSTAGDVNGDGYSDVIVGAQVYDNGETDEGRAFVYHGSASGLSTSADWTAEGDQTGAEFGCSVSTAGDVNGDGFSDVVVGAPEYDNGQVDEGAAFVYHGSASGLSPSAIWTAESDQVDVSFGHSVSTAGDVDGDGFSDVIVGAFACGRAFVYHGSASGLSPSPKWTGEGGQVTSYFGWSVSTAGDVNGDGFSDVIVGAHYHDNNETDEGAAFVYHGSASGLSPSSSWTAEGGQEAAHFGWSVSTAGDVNGDGFSDVIVGAFYHDNGESEEGRAFVYHGSASGLSTSADWIAEGNQTYAEFGGSVSAAGDVNGDGFSDVVVGACYYDNGQNNEGRAYVYHGSASGLSSSASWTAEGDQAGAHFGWSVSNAGDVNGDGFGDVLVSAPHYDAGQVDIGKVYVYYGNGGNGLSRSPRQARSDGSALVGPLGMSDSPDSFRLEALGRVPSGRGLVRLEWEVKPLGTAFDGTGIEHGPWTDTGSPGANGFAGSAVELDELVSGLAGSTAYHWRLRIASKDPAFPHTPWLSPPWNGSTETDIRTEEAPQGATLSVLVVDPQPTGCVLNRWMPFWLEVRGGCPVGSGSEKLHGFEFWLEHDAAVAFDLENTGYGDDLTFSGGACQWSCAGGTQGPDQYYAQEVEDGGKRYLHVGVVFDDDEEDGCDKVLGTIAEGSLLLKLRFHVKDYPTRANPTENTVDFAFRGDAYQPYYVKLSSGGVPEEVAVPAPVGIEDLVIANANLFVRGNATGHWSSDPVVAPPADPTPAIDLNDGLRILKHLFVDAAAHPLPCLEASDTNQDDRINLVDAVYVFQWLFGNAPDFPEPLAHLGVDADGDGTACAESQI
jgi:hypothetical protein